MLKPLKVEHFICDYMRGGEAGILELAKPSEIPQFSCGRTRFYLHPAEILVPINALERELLVSPSSGGLYCFLP